jgi:hypothetical protein
MTRACPIQREYRSLCYNFFQVLYMGPIHRRYVCHLPYCRWVLSSRLKFFSSLRIVLSCKLHSRKGYIQLQHLKNFVFPSTRIYLISFKFVLLSYFEQAESITVCLMVKPEHFADTLSKHPKSKQSERGIWTNACSNGMLNKTPQIVSILYWKFSAYRHAPVDSYDAASLWLENLLLIKENDEIWSVNMSFSSNCNHIQVKDGCKFGSFCVCRSKKITLKLASKLTGMNLSCWTVTQFITALSLQSALKVQHL